MSMTLGGCALSEHDPDPEERNHNIIPGNWVRATCRESDAAHAGHEVHVWSTLTDISGEFGEPRIFTEWGTPDGKLPVNADLRWIDSDKPCEHYVYKAVA